LRSYATAALAAGIGVLSPHSAQAKVVFTPKHQTLLPGHNLLLDLNGDGVNDFDLGDGRFVNGTISSSGFLDVGPAGAPFSNKVLWGSLIGSSAFAKVVAPGVTLSSQQRFVNYPMRMAYCLGRGGAVSHREGRWVNATNRYLGLQFFINGQPHFGWARFTVRLGTGSPCGFEAVLSGYAYETVVNVPIVTGQTMDATESGAQPGVSSSQTQPSLGMLALGAPALFIWRREERNTAIDRYEG
jgi:hypothetical protein